MENATLSSCTEWSKEFPGKERFNFCVFLLSQLFLNPIIRAPPALLTMVLNSVTETVRVCDKITIENSTSDYLQCRKENGMAIGYCSFALQGIESQNFWKCFDKIKDFQAVNPDTILTKWKFFQLFCDESKSNVFCKEYYVKRDIVYSIDSRFLDTEEKAFYFTYVVPVLGFITVILNGFILYILTAKMSSNSNIFFLRLKAVCDALTVAPQLPIVLYFITFKSEVDFLPYNICIVINLCMVILPAAFHTVSIFVAIGISFQKYFIVSFPLKARMYLRLKYIYIYILVSLGIALSIFTPSVVVLCNMRSIEVQSKLVYDEFIITMAAVLPDDSNQWMKLVDEFGVVLRTLILQCLPCFFLLFFEIIGIRRSKFYIKNTKKLQEQNQPSSTNSSLSQVVYMSFANVGIFIVAELPNAVAFLYYTVADYSQTKQMEAFDVVSTIMNTITWLSFTSSLFVCIVFCKEFRNACLDCIGWLKC